MIFNGTIHLPDDATRLTAALTVEGDTLRIESEGQEIGRWSIADLTTTHRPDGIVIQVDGESIIVNPDDKHAFTDALENMAATAPKRRTLRLRRKKTDVDGPPKPQPEPAKPAPTPEARSDAQPLYPRAPSSPGPEPAGAVPSRREPVDVPVVDQLLGPDDDTVEVAHAPSPRADGQPVTTPASGPEPQRSLPAVDPPPPESWPGGVTGATDEAEPEIRAQRPPTSSTSTGETAWIDREIAEARPDGIEVVRPPKPAPGPPAAEPAPEPPGEPAPGLADAIRSAPPEPIVQGFRETDDADEGEPPVDLTTEIFGPDEQPPPKRRALGNLGERWMEIPAVRRRIVLGVAVGVLLWLLVPRVVATALMLSGLVGCLAGGAGLADPTYTRRLPASISEVHLLIWGGIALVVGFLVGLPSL